MRLVPLKLSFRHLFSTLCAGTGSCFDRLIEAPQTRPDRFLFAPLLLNPEGWSG
jgi:hypothetical protein